jgi:glycosyltransferase involved in cell wall biosynthesis
VISDRMPLVSVIIPSHNRAWILKEAIDSVFAQRFRDFELIIVDDGSTDNTPELLAAYTTLRVARQDHSGVSAARNRGISLARGRYVAFLDSDDLWLPDKLSAQTAFFRKRPDALICQTEETWIRNGVQVNPKRRHIKPSGMIFEDSTRLCLVSPSAVMIRRSLFDQVGVYDERLPACEDYDLWLRTTCRFPVYLLPPPLVIKRGGHRDQLSRQPGLDRFRIYALRKILENPPAPGLSRTQERAAVDVLREKCSIYASGCLKRGRVEEARYYLDLRDRFSSSRLPVR